MDGGGGKMTGYTKPEVLVETDWLEEHLDDPAIRVIEVDEDTDGLREGPHPGRGRAGTGRPTCTPRSAATTSTRPALGAAVEGRRRRRHDRDPVRRQQQLVRRLRLLAAEAPRVRRREAAERRPQEVGAREPRADAGRAVVRPDRVRDLGPGAAGDPRAPRRGARARSAARPGSSTCARPRSTGARSSLRTTCRRSSRRSRATSPARRTSRGRRLRTTTARSSARTSCARSTRPRASPPDREIIAYCRIGERSSHTWFALQELLGYPNVKNYDGSWTEYGSLVGAPVEKG